jgi:hypothetical protein
MTNVWQQLLQALHVLPVNLILADALPRSEVIMGLGIGAEFAAVEATRAALPGGLGIDRAMAIAALHVDSSAASTPNGVPRFPQREGQRLVPDPPEKWADRSGIRHRLGIRSPFPDDRIPFG